MVSSVRVSTESRTYEEGSRPEDESELGAAMASMKDLMREYERVRYPADRRLDLHGEGPSVARDRALHWIQSRAHESPGEELLLIVERGSTRGRRPGAVAECVRKLLEELEGRLIEWWQPFAPGSYAVRIATDPRMAPVQEPRVTDLDGGRTAETAGAARPSPLSDIPAALLGTARHAVELRLAREGLSVRLEEVVLREIWIDAQARAMEKRTSFELALEEILAEESLRALDDG